MKLMNRPLVKLKKQLSWRKPRRKQEESLLRKKLEEMPLLQKREGTEKQWKPLKEGLRSLQKPRKLRKQRRKLQGSLTNYREQSGQLRSIKTG